MPALLVLAGAIFAAVTTEMLPVGLMPQLARTFEVDEGRIGWWMSAYAGVVAVAAIPMAGLLRRVARRRALIALLLLYAVSNCGILAAGAVGHVGVALAARLVGGLAHAGLFTVVISTAVAISPVAVQGRAVAGVNLGLTAALTLGVPLGTAVGSAWAWQGAFAATALVLVALAVAARVLLPAGEDGRGPARAARVGREAPDPSRARGALVRAAVVTAVFALGHYSVYTYVAPLLLRVGVADAQVGAVLFGHGLACLPGVLAAGALADRCPRAALRASFAVTAACLVVIAAAPREPVATIAAVVVWGAAFAAAPALLQVVAIRISGRPDMAPAAVNAMFNVGIATGALAGGAVLARGTTVLAWVGAGVVVAALALSALLPRVRRTGPHRTATAPGDQLAAEPGRAAARF